MAMTDQELLALHAEVVGRDEVTVNPTLKENQT